MKKFRDKEKLLVAEGVRLVEEAVAAAPVRFALVAEKSGGERLQNLLNDLQEKQIPVYEIAPGAFAKLSATKSPQGILAVVEQMPVALTHFAAAKFLVVLDNVRDPGNAGAIIRTADAFAADGVVFLKNSVDVWSDKTVRSTMGSIFHVPVAVNVAAEDFAIFAAAQNLKIILPLLDATAKPCHAANMTEPLAVVLGNEANGATEEFRQAIASTAAKSETVYIPMPGRAESLNVANAAAVLLYERLRQGVV